MNDLFVCTRCGHVDLSDLAASAVRHHNGMRKLNQTRNTPGSVPAGAPIEFVPRVCTKCLTGTWHGDFPYLPYNPVTDKDKVVNPPLA